MTVMDIRNWIYNEFSPLTLSIGQPNIDQQINSAIRYWNTHSAYKITKMYPVASQAVNFLSLDTEIKNVATCYPSMMQEELFSNHPMWALLGFVTLDQFTNDLIMLSNAFEGYRIYLGQDFRWRYERSVDQDNVPGKLYLQKIPSGAGAIAVVGLKWILPGENITDAFILDWVLQYSLALIKVKEGNARRMGQIIGIQNDGEKMSDEGAASIEALQKKLSQESAWCLLAARK